MLAGVHVAVAVIRRGRRVLVARRPQHLHQGGLLEFPGGKVEPDETVQQALVREVAEETGLVLNPGCLSPLITVRHDYGDKEVVLDVWTTEGVSGHPVGLEGQDIGWLDLDRLRDADFPAANRPIIRAARLPRQYAITGAFDSPARGIARLRRALETSRPELLCLRAPWLDDDAYDAFAAMALGLCEERKVPVMVHGSVERLRDNEAAGLHLPWREAERLTARPIDSDLWLGVSCHCPAQLEHAARLGADFVTLGPVHATASHPHATPMGWGRFAGLVGAASLPVYALGGTAPEHSGRAHDAGAQGIAGISYWW